jgi:hypothetical protein
MVYARAGRGKAPSPRADDGAQKVRRGAGCEPKGLISMKAKAYRLGLTVGMLAVLVEALGAGMKWG